MFSCWQCKIELYGWTEDRQSREIPKGKICYVIGSTHAWEMHANCKLVAKLSCRRQLGLIWIQTTDLGDLAFFRYTEKAEVVTERRGRLKLESHAACEWLFFVVVVVKFSPNTSNITCIVKRKSTQKLLILSSSLHWAVCKENGMVVYYNPSWF